MIDSRMAFFGTFAGITGSHSNMPNFLASTTSTHLVANWKSFSICLVLVICSTFADAYAQTSLITSASTVSERVSAVIQTDQVHAELIAHAPDGVGVAKPFWLGLKLTHQPDWHTYWKNPGDSGLPTTLTWSLPKGVTTSDIAWPTPSLIKVGAMGNYGYGDTVLLPVTLTIGKDFAANPQGDLEVRLHASWLVCRQECIPQEGDFQLRVPLRGSVAMHRADFDAARASEPQDWKGATKATVNNEGIQLEIDGLPSAWLGKDLQVFPESPNIADPSTSPKQQRWTGSRWSALLPLSAQREGTVSEMPIVFAWQGQSIRTVIKIGGSWPALVDPNVVAPATVTAPLTGASLPVVPLQVTMSSWGFAMLAALLGGVILNLMPCVLPVLAIKVLGFSQHAGKYHREHRAQGVAYTLGVVLSFMALGGLMLALRATGQQLGWGFQLQSTGVVAAMAVLFTLLGLNLAGVFEIGNLLPHRLASLQASHPTTDAFLSGILAVAIASPCTAPFMGASLGYAITLPSAQAMGIFAALGVGLALPFLLASWIPAFGRMLPKPGAWMDTLKRFMAFPMFATVVWLLWVLGHLSGVDGAASLLALLVALALLTWSLGFEGRSRMVLTLISVAAFGLLAASIGQNVFHTEDMAASSETSPGTSVNASAIWQAWAPGRVEAELAKGQPVFVDFTAAWCITCQYNKKTTLQRADVLADFAARKVTLLRADWTRRDPAISMALEQLGRSGVPVYVLYQQGHEPVLFSEILSASDLRDAIAKL